MLILLIWKGKKRLVNHKNPWELCSVLFWFSVESLLTDCGETVGESVRAHLRSKFHRHVSQGANCTHKVHFHCLKATFQTWLRSGYLSLFYHHHSWFSVTSNENTYLLVSPKLCLTELWNVCQREASPCKIDDSPSERGALPEFLCLLFKYPPTLSIGVNFRQ